MASCDIIPRIYNRSGVEVESILFKDMMDSGMTRDEAMKVYETVHGQPFLDIFGRWNLVKDKVRISKEETLSFKSRAAANAKAITLNERYGKDTATVFHRPHAKTHQFRVSIDYPMRPAFLEFIDENGEPTSDVIFNNEAFMHLDGIYNQEGGSTKIKDRGEAYPALTATQRDTLNGQLDKRIEAWLDRYGIKLEVLDNIRDQNGDIISASAKADMLHRVVQVMKEEASTDILTEEAAHFFVEMLPEDHPLLKRMMSIIERYDVYDEVKNGYGSLPLYTEERIKKEAIGKLIANRIVKNWSQGNNSQANIDSANTWWKALLSNMKRLFSSARSTDTRRMIDDFDIAAETMLKENVEISTENITDTGEYYHLQNKGVTKAELDKRLNATQEEISPVKHIEIGKFGEEIERYKTKDGKVIKRRVTDVQDALFGKGRSKLKAREINESPRSERSRRFGTLAHEVMEGLMHDVMGAEKHTRPDWLPEGSYNAMRKVAASIVNESKDIQKQIDPNEEIELRTENIVYDVKADIAGSTDVIIQFSDGSISVYDWKFIRFKTNRHGVIIEDDSKMAYKEMSYDMQISEYKRILKEVYGVDQVRRSRVIPANIQFKTTGRGKATKELDEIKYIQMGGENESLKQIPLARELTEDPELNKLIEELHDERDKLSEAMRGAKDQSAIKARIATISKSLKALQLDYDVSYVVEEAVSMSKDINDRIGIEDENDPNYMSDAELLEVSNTLKAYTGVINRTKDAVNKLDFEKQVEILKRIDTFAGAAARLDTELYAKMEDRYAKMAMEEGITDPLEPQKETSITKNQTKYLSDWNHPVFRTFKKLIDAVLNNTRRDFNTFHEETVKIGDELVAWGKRNGMTGISVFDRLLNKDNNLISEFSDEFYRERERAREERDIKWLKENLYQSEEDKKRFLEDKKRNDNYVNIAYKKESDAFRNKKKKEWLMANDPQHDDAWSNTYSRLSAKDKGKWHSEEYKYMIRPGNEPLKRYYEYHQQANKRFNDMLPQDKRVGRNFVAYIHKSMIESAFGSGRVSVNGLGSIMGTSMEVRPDDEEFGMRNERTGKTEKRIPVLYMKPFRDNQGEIDNDQKSRDLTRNLLLMGRMAIEYAHLEQVEDKVSLMREILSKQKQVKTDEFGNPVLRSINKILDLSGTSRGTIEAFEQYAGAYLYGQNVQDVFTKDHELTVLGRKTSVKRVIKKAMSFFSAKTLMVNPISGSAAWLGALSNAYMMGAKGVYYSNANMLETHRLFITRDRKYIAARGYFETYQEDLTYHKANQASVMFMERHFTDRNLYPQRKADEMVENNMTVSMMMNYGIEKETGKVKRLKKLPAGTPSLWNTLSIVNDKVQIEGLTEEGYNQFRMIVRKVASNVKGNMSKEDMLLMQTTLEGQMMLQFRSWMLKLVAERFRGAKFDHELDEIELGRYRVLFGEIAKKGLMPKLNTTFSLASEVMSFGLWKQKADPTRTKFYFEEFLAENPGYEGTIEDYKEIRQGQLRAAAMELRMYAIVLGAMAALTGDWDDDGEPDYKNWDESTQKVIEIIIKLLDKLAMEIGFTFRPSEAKNLIRSPIPLMGLIMDTERLVSNTFDETTDILFGEDEDYDKSGRFKYTAKFIPFINPMSALFDWFEYIPKAEREEEPEPIFGEKE